MADKTTDPKAADAPKADTTRSDAPRSDAPSPGKHASKSSGDTVLVSPAGIHTPGRTAMGGESPYVQVPADAAADPEATRAAYEKAQRGEHDVTLPAGVIPQNPDGSAMTREQADQAVEDEAEQRDYVEGRGDAPAPKR
jgi:hypothetical protein